jgi:RNA exonuclease 1
MWPSVPSFRSFGDIACPSGATCELPYCIFLHGGPKAPKVPPTKDLVTSNTVLLDGELPSAKRLKLDNGAKQPNQQTDEASSQMSKPQVFVGSLASDKGPGVDVCKLSTSSNATTVQGKSGDELPRTATRPVSPPPKKTETVVPFNAEVVVPLMPRNLAKEPASFTRRFTMIKALHQYMFPLNEKVARAVKPEIRALNLSVNQLNKLVVDEEEKIAKENGPVYENVLKQRMAALKKMTLVEWCKERRDAIAKEKGDLPKKLPPKKVDTGLSPKEEVTLLSTLTATQAILDAHGILTKPPTETELEKARSAQVSADFWEECDRCGTRFQVFPDRRQEDGALTTGGTCQHHWGKRLFGKRTKGQPAEPTRFTCCNEVVGSPGCTTHDTHVYKTSDAKRMSLVMPFIETPDNDQVEPHAAVCFDCEMGYTTHGLELLRLTAVSWPSHKPLVDVLVRPLGHVLDLNTRFSGVTPEQFLNAKPYDPDNPKPKRKDLRIVESPHTARDLFLSHVSTKTPVLGHAIENDLNVIRLIHPTIVDTVILYPAHGGLPYRNGLKKLAKLHLDMDIQQGGAAGHDSYEDAKTTGELIRFKVASTWQRKKEDGWTISDDGVYPPMPEGIPPPFASAPPAPSMIGMLNVIDMKGSKSEKRKLENLNGNEGAGNEQLNKRPG